MMKGKTMGKFSKLTTSKLLVSFGEYIQGVL